MRRLVLLAPLALLLAACGGSSPTPTETRTAAAAGPLAAAAQKTQAAGSEKMQMQATIRLTPKSAFVLSGSGAFDDKANDGVLNSTIAVPNSGSTTLQEVFSRSTMWLKSPLFAAALPADKSWLKLDLTNTKAADSLGFDFKALTGQNPGDVLSQLEQTGKVTALGKEKVGGVETTRYRGTIDSQSGQADSTTGAIYKPVDVWVDDQGLVRKVQLDYTARTDPSKPARSHVVLVMTFSNFGTPVKVTTPSDSESLDASNSGSIGG
jgi:LppX_LprAFG lipoprotein